MDGDRSNEFLAAANKFYDGIDRGILGSFAVSRHLVVLVDAYQRTKVFIAPNAESVMLKSSKVVAKCNAENVLLADVMAEVSFWWKRTKMDNQLLAYQKTNESRYSREATEHLSLIADNPARLPFFERGIWDMGYISECLANDIDVELALSLLAAKS